MQATRSNPAKDPDRKHAKSSTHQQEQKPNNVDRPAQIGNRREGTHTQMLLPQRERHDRRPPAATIAQASPSNSESLPQMALSDQSVNNRQKFCRALLNDE